MKWWIGMLVVLALAGCGAPAGPAPVGGVSAAHPYPLTIQRTGGIAGVNESITVRSDGGWSYTAARGKPAAQGTLTADVLDQVTQTVSNPAFAADVRGGKAGQCADAFSYAVSIGPETSTFEECGGPDRPLFSALMSVLSKHTPF
jgi:hypothetical protein